MATDTLEPESKESQSLVSAMPHNSGVEVAWGVAGLFAS